MIGLSTNKTVRPNLLWSMQMEHNQYFDNLIFSLKSIHHVHNYCCSIKLRNLLVAQQVLATL